jgi:hypothetical protein
MHRTGGGSFEGDFWCLICLYQAFALVWLQMTSQEDTIFGHCLTELWELLTSL